MIEGDEKSDGRVRYARRGAERRRDATSGGWDGDAGWLGLIVRESRTSSRDRLWALPAVPPLIIDPRLERAIIAELSRAGRVARVRRFDRSRARALAERLHRGQQDMLAHLLRVAYAVPAHCRGVAWLHHARDHNVTARELTSAGLVRAELEAIEFFTGTPAHAAEIELARARAITQTPGRAGRYARVVARAAIMDVLLHEHFDDDLLPVLTLLSDGGRAGHERSPDRGDSASL